MRELFPGYYRPSDEDFHQLWQECVFVFDANVLLNIYRYSSDTREAFLEILHSLKDRIWLPHQAAFEYQKNRLNVLSAQFKAYDDISKLLEATQAELKSSYPRHPFIPVQQVTATFNTAVTDITRLLDEAKAAHPDLSEADTLRDRLTELFEGRVGEPFNNERLVRVYEEAEMRFPKLIPPGYKDTKKDSEQKYGDLVLWNQVKEFAKSERKSLVLVTDDKKDDWWEEHKGKTIGPRPELVQEMQVEAGIKFYMYQSDQFIEYAQKLVGRTEQVRPNAERVLEEVREVRQQESGQKEIQQLADSIHSDERYQRALRRILSDGLEGDALLFLAESARTFTELKKFFGDDSRRARNFLESTLNRGLVETISTNPNRFFVTEDAKRLATYAMPWLTNSRGEGL